jgi:hypothetical protein
MHVCYREMADNPFAVPRERQEERYEPFPSIPRIPMWVWRRLPRAGKVVVALLPFVIVALVLALAPGIDETKDRRAEAEAQRLESARAEREAEIRREQRVRFATGAPATDVPGRGRLLDAAAVSVGADARERVAAGELRGPIRRVECEPYPRSVGGRGAHRSLESRYGRYACLAITAEFGGNQLSEASVIGHPYRLRIDFETGRYGYCKVVGRPAEGSLSGRPVVAVARACGGS